MTVKPLTHTEVKNASPQTKDYSIFDGFGLLLYVSRTGCKTWRFRYVHPVKNKRQTYTIGGFPQFSLAEAREEREKLRKLVARGIDPNEVKKENASVKRKKKAQTVEVVAEDWLNMKAPDYRLNTWLSCKQFVSNINRMFGQVPISQLTAVNVIESLRAYSDKPSLRHEIIGCLNNIMEYAVNSGLISINPLAKIRKAFPALKIAPFPTLNKCELPQFMAFWNSSDNMTPVTNFALKFQIATMVRPGEAVGASWSEFNLDKLEWKIPGERMKAGRQHTVPLSRYVFGILTEMKKWKLSGNDFVFPSLMKPGKSIIRSTLNSRIRMSEYNGRIVPHGFRSLASTVLNEEGFHPDVIEAALAHKSGDAIRNIYNRTTYLEKRRVMMEWWGDFIEAAERGEILETTGDKGLRIVG